MTLGVSGGLSGGILELKIDLVGHAGHLGGHFDRILVVLGRILGASLAILGALGAILERSWAVLGTSWEDLGGVLASIWAVPGPS